VSTHSSRLPAGEQDTAALLAAARTAGAPGVLASEAARVAAQPPGYRVGVGLLLAEYAVFHTDHLDTSTLPWLLPLAAHLSTGRRAAALMDLHCHLGRRCTTAQAADTLATLAAAAAASDPRLAQQRALAAATDPARVGDRPFGTPR